ncbi:hypothetical protein [Mycolicibacterium bacteremicum]|uniref:hypothetical protein n=1 Tax=Mycolicibacterium bacteremicum TaxID=564198 RepID=UPI0026ECBC17|nr:hypothetical protein [Mycolicibacterium bacteremicum]
MNPIDYVRLGIEQYLRELPDDEFDELMQRVRPPDGSDAKTGTSAFVGQVLERRR